MQALSDVECRAHDLLNPLVGFAASCFGMAIASAIGHTAPELKRLGHATGVGTSHVKPGGGGPGCTPSTWKIVTQWLW